MYGWMDRRVGGWIGGWIGERMDGCMEENAQYPWHASPPLLKKSCFPRIALQPAVAIARHCTLEDEKKIRRAMTCSMP